MNFEFATATQIQFGSGAIEKVGRAAAELGKKALVVASHAGGNLDRLKDLLTASHVSFATISISGEPSVQTVVDGCAAARNEGCDFVLGMGGGSALDTAKAVAAMLTNPGDLLDYLEVVGRGQSLKVQPAPFILIPTTSGTGSEVTRNAVISVPEQQVKVSLRSPMMMAKLALVDPQLTFSLPPDVTASTGMDALTQVIEPYVSKRANSFTDLFCREGILRGARSLLQAYRHGDDEAVRIDMAYTSLLGGMALANAGLGAVHGFAGPIGGMFHAPHGAICACLLPPVVMMNTRALFEREPNHPALARYAEIAQMVTGKDKARQVDLVDWLSELRKSLAIPSLSDFGVRAEHLSMLVEKSAAASSMKANPIALLKEELYEILENAL